MTYEELTVLIPGHSLEDFPTELAEKPASSLLNAFAVIWHPSLLASTGAFPQWRRADDPLPAAPNRLVIVPTACDSLVPDGWIERSRREGMVVITGEHEREPMLAKALEPLDVPETLDPDLAADFLALGTVHLQTELLTRQMRNFSNLDEAYLQREAVAAAKGALAGDAEAARKHLGYCFEMLLEGRERFYPVDCFLVDLCLVTPDLAGEKLKRLLHGTLPVNLMAPAQDWQQIIDADPGLQDEMRGALEREIADLVGGDDVELPGPMISLDDTLWHLRAGRETMRQLLSRAPRTWGRKRFGLGAHLPQILDRLGYEGAFHFLLDDGLYPDEEQSLFRWEGTDGTCINACSRIPLAADGASSMLRFPQRMSESMDYDHVAGVIFARWPQMRTPFFDDFRRAHHYAPVLGRFVTVTEFFGQSSSPGRKSEHKSGSYLSPSLIHAVAKREEVPISRWVKYWERQRRFERADWVDRAADFFATGRIDSTASENLERFARNAHVESSSDAQQAADSDIATRAQIGAERLAEIIARDGSTGPGVLVFNTLSFPRKALIPWPEGSVPVEQQGVRAIQIDGNQAWALVDLPPCGFLWLSGTSHHGDNTAPGKVPMAEELLLRNELFEVQLSAVTGGIAQVQTYRRSPNRISQQVALRFPHAKQVLAGEDDEQETIETFYTAMQLREWRILSEGPLIGEIETLGDLLDEQTGQVQATYRQRTRVVRGRSVIQVELEVAPAEVPQGDPWTNYIGCRFAWKHIDVALTGSMQQGAQAIRAERIEAPHYIEIADDDFRTTILTPGLPFHRKTGERMLDTLLITEGETERNFRFSIAIDSKYPMQACLDEFCPPVVLPVSQQPSEGSQPGWFFNVTAANVQLTRILPGRSDNSLIVRLLETEGRARVFGLECCRPPQAARQLKFNGDVLSTLQVDDAVNIEIGPYEICDIELEF